VVMRRALFAWAVWLAMLPNLLGAMTPPKAEAQALPTVTILGATFLVDAPVVLAVIVAAAAYTGYAYCISSVECATFVQELVDDLPTWYLQGLIDAYNAGRGSFRASDFSGFDNDELAAAFAANYHGITWTTGTSAGSLLAPTVVGAPATEWAQLPSAASSASAIYWTSQPIPMPTITFVEGSSSTFAPNVIEYLVPKSGNVVGAWTTGLVARATTCSGCSTTFATSGTPTTWPTTSAKFCGTGGQSPGADMSMSYANAAGGTGSSVKLASGFYYRWRSAAGCTGSVSAWVYSSPYAGTFASGGQNVITGTTFGGATSAVAMPAPGAVRPGTLLTPTTQVGTLTGGVTTVKDGSEATSSGNATNGLLGSVLIALGPLGALATLLSGLPAFLTVATSFFADFPTVLGDALTSALSPALTAAFVPETTLESRVSALAAVLETKPPVSYVAKVQDAWADATTFGAECPALSVPYAPWSQTTFEMCLPSGVGDWTRAFSQFVAAAGLALWAWGFYRRLLE